MPCRRLAALALLLLMSHAAAAAELKVLSAGAVEPGLRTAVQRFERESGHTVSLTFAAAPALRERAATQAAAAAAGFDVLIAPAAVLDAVASAGTVRADRVTLGAVGIGVAVRPDAPRPDITSPDALKAALSAAESLVYNRASTGLYIEQLLKRLGLGESLAGKTTRVADGAAVVQRLLQSRGREFGFAAITEIQLKKDIGLVYVGPLPPELQHRTVYQASVASRPSDEAAAMQLWRHLASAETQAAMRAAGID
jgi:molybdate transport system substrate-binding protein